MKHEAGLSLVEVVIATVVIAVIASGVFATSMFSKRSGLIMQQKLIAMSKAEAQMNYLKNGGAEGLPDNTGETLTACTPSDLPCCQFRKVKTQYQCFSEMDGRMNLAVSTIIRIPDPQNQKMKEVVVRADWQDLMGAERNESIATVIRG